MRLKAYLAATATLATIFANETLPFIRAAEAEAKPEAVLSIVNEHGEKTELTPADLKKLPRKSLKAKDHAGEEHSFEGVAVAELLKNAKVTLGKDLRGPLLSNYVLVEARDTYRVVFALPEFDPDFTDNVVLLADTQDGRPLAESYAPLRMVVSHEKRQSRWIKQVVRISILQSPAAVKK